MGVTGWWGETHVPDLAVSCIRSLAASAAARSKRLGQPEVRLAQAIHLEGVASLDAPLQLLPMQQAAC